MQKLQAVGGFVTISNHFMLCYKFARVIDTVHCFHILYLILN